MAEEITMEQDLGHVLEATLPSGETRSQDAVEKAAAPATPEPLDGLGIRPEDEDPGEAGDSREADDDEEDDEV